MTARAPLIHTVASLTHIYWGLYRPQAQKVTVGEPWSKPSTTPAPARCAGPVHPRAARPRAAPRRRRRGVAARGHAAVERRRVSRDREVLGRRLLQAGAGHIFGAIRVLMERGEAIDAVTVTDELKRSGVLEQVGDPSIFISLQANTPSIADPRHYGGSSRSTRCCASSSAWLVRPRTRSMWARSSASCWTTMIQRCGCRVSRRPATGMVPVVTPSSAASSGSHHSCFLGASPGWAGRGWRRWVIGAPARCRICVTRRWRIGPAPRAGRNPSASRGAGRRGAPGIPARAGQVR